MHEPTERSWAATARAATTLLAYLLFPLLYFTVYLPLIVPRLAGWHRIPYGITISLGAIYLLVVAAVGVGRSHKTILLHALGLAGSIHVFIFIVSRLQMPGFLKAYESRFFPEAIPRILVTGILLTLVAEAGRFVSRARRNGPTGVAKQAVGNDLRRASHG